MRINAKSLLTVLLLTIFTFTLSACNEFALPGNTTTETTITDVSFDQTVLESSYEISDFNIEDFFLTVTFSDGSTSQIKITESMISSSDIEKLSVAGIQTIEVLYQDLIVSITVNLIDSAGSIKVTFETNGGIALDPQFVQEGKTLTLPIPVKEGHTFTGWFTGDGPNDIQFSDFVPLVNDIILYAKWEINEYTITFDSNGGSYIESISGFYNTELLMQLEPIKDGYTFNGWIPDLNRIPGENMTLEAQWLVNEYSITYITVTQKFFSDIELQIGETIIKVIGGSHNLVMTSSGRIFTWGLNNTGQLGDGTTTNRDVPVEITSNFNLTEGETIMEVSLGAQHSSLLTSSGRLFIWGYNSVGNLGDGTRINKHTPVEITSHFDLSAGEAITQVALGRYHSSALTSTGRIFTWGYNNSGQLGDGTTTDRSTPVEITSNFNLTEGETIQSIFLGVDQSSAITSTGRVFTWGFNNTGQLGDGTTTNRDVPVQITSKFNLTEGETITQISLYYYSSAAITSSGRIFTWGRNDYGQLGVGTTNDRTYPIDITSNINLTEGESISGVSVGWSYVNAFTSKGRIFTWGSFQTIIIKPLDITLSFNLFPGEIVTEVSYSAGYSFVLTSSGCLFKWQKISDSPINLISNIFDITNIVSYNFNEEIVDFTPMLEGYTFSGWYIDESLSIPYTKTYMPSEDITLYAKWVAN